jgi:hypothetical protein
VDPRRAAPAPEFQGGPEGRPRRRRGWYRCDGGEAQDRISAQSVSALQNGSPRAPEEGGSRGSSRLGFGLATLPPMTDPLDQLVNEYEAAASRLTDLHRRWGWIVLLGPREPGQAAPTMPRDQLDLEEQIQQAWADYVEKRNAYLAAAGFPKPA